MRLHEYLHEKSTPEEAELVVFMHGEGGRRKIMEDVIWPRVEKVGEEHLLSVCYGCEWCEVGLKNLRCAFKETPECCGLCNFFKRDSAGAGCEKCSSVHRSECKFKPQKVRAVRGRIIQSRIVEADWRSEVEKICDRLVGRSVDIRGYVDIYFVVRVVVAHDLEVEPGWVWRDFKKEEREFHIIVECKPQIKAFQDVLRQVKTYAYILSRGADREIIMVVATYSSLPPKVAEIMRKEGVYIIEVKRQSVEEISSGNAIEEFRGIADSLAKYIRKYSRVLEEAGIRENAEEVLEALNVLEKDLKAYYAPLEEY